MLGVKGLRIGGEQTAGTTRSPRIVTRRDLVRGQGLSAYAGGLVTSSFSVDLRRVRGCKRGLRPLAVLRPLVLWGLGARGGRGGEGKREWTSSSF